MDLAVRRHRRSVTDDPPVREEGAPETGPERHADCAGMTCRCPCQRLAEQERIGVVHERDRVSRQLEAGGQGRAEVDAVQRLQLVPDPTNACRVVERAGNRARDAGALAEHLPRCADDEREQLAPVGVRRERDAGPALDRRPGQVDAAGEHVAAPEIERRHDAGHATNAFTTLQAPPRRRRRRYAPTEAGTTIVSA